MKPISKTEQRRLEAQERKQKRIQEKEQRIADSVRVPFSGFDSLQPWPYPKDTLDKNSSFYYRYFKQLLELGMKDYIRESIQELDQTLNFVKQTARVYAGLPDPYIFKGMKRQWEQKISQVSVIRRALLKAYRDVKNFR